MQNICRRGLNFRDLHCFNHALLAKTAWRLCTVDDTVWSSSTQAKYFKNSAPLHCQRKKDSTWSWKSISSEFEFIRKYSFWSLGDGKKILVRKDKWVVGLDEAPTTSSAAVNSHEVTYVSELIDSTNNCWRSEVILNLFDSNTAALILNMRIPRSCKDKLMWTLTKTGSFTVKSAYYALYNQKYHQGEDQSQAYSSSIWKHVWSINAIPRIKHFVWKCMKDILPSNERLNRNYRQEDTRCQRCKNGEETSLHLLVYCPFARAIWFNTIGYRCSDAQFTTLKDWILSWFANDAELISKMATVAWHIWKCRCELIFGNKNCTIQSLTNRINKFLNSAASVTRNDCTLVSNTPLHKWIPPSMGFVKINCDASYCSIVKNGGYGLIIRNDAGTHLASRCRYFSKVPGSEFMECLAALEAMEWAHSFGFKKIVIETDYQPVTINSRELSIPWEYRGSAEDIKSSLFNFESCICTYTNRLANKCADELAKYARKEGVTGIWLSQYPAVLESFIVSDISS